MANGREQHRRGPARDHGGAGRGLDLGDVADEIDEHELAGVERREVRSQFQYDAPGRLDLGRRGRAGDVSGAGSLRRMRARRGRARVAGVRAEDAQGIYLPGAALRVIDPGDVEAISGDGATVPAQGELRRSG